MSAKFTRNIEKRFPFRFRPLILFETSETEKNENFEARE